MIGSREFKSKFDSVYVDYSDPNLLVNYVTDLLVSAADQAKEKCRRFDSKKDPPWFDKQT